MPTGAGLGLQASNHSPGPSVVTDSQMETSPFTPTRGDGGLGAMPAGKMIKDDGVIRFVDSPIWSSVLDEVSELARVLFSCSSRALLWAPWLTTNARVQLQAMKDIVDTDEPEDASAAQSESLTPENNADLFFSADASPGAFDDLQPDPVHIFRLWQIYIDRVNPIYKVIHIPTTQQHIVDAASNVNSMALNSQALVFSICTMAIIAMSDNESIQILSLPRDKALQRFTSACKSALIRCNFIKNHDMTSIQALTLYLVSSFLAE